MSNAISRLESQVAKLKAEYHAITHDPDATYRMSCFGQEEMQTKAQELALAQARLWALQKAQENSTPQSGYRLAYVAG